jgi:TatA/E family protein of Tat protein translocase
MGEFSIFHWLIVLAVVLIFFGGRRIPEIMNEFGEAIMRVKQQPQPRPLRLSRGETPWQAFTRYLPRLLSKVRNRVRTKRE